MNITLTKELFSNEIPNEIRMPTNLLINKLKVVATYTEDDSEANIFLFSKRDESIEFNEDISDFIGVASLEDMSAITDTVPGDGDSIPVFRYHTVEVMTRTKEEANFIWDEIKDDVSGLVGTYKELEGLTIIQEEEQIEPEN